MMSVARGRVLVLGGTAWLGGYLAAAALERGHEVSCLARGQAGAAPGGCRCVWADRDRPDAYDDVAGEHWNAVIDVSRQPGQVRRAVEALSGCSEAFVLVSSVSVYAEHRSPGQAEDASLLAALEGEVRESMETYGQAKVACEQHVLSAFGSARSLIARVGLIGGPGDISDRTGYWPWRFANPAAEDGSVLVPDAPELLTQVIDVRDLATWLVDGAIDGRRGIFNCTGEAVGLSRHLRAARAVAGHTGRVVAADENWLLAHGVEPWMGDRSLPIWLPLVHYAGFNARDSSAARAAGLVTRPLEETLADTLAWERTRDPSLRRRAGLTDEDERSLLRARADA